MRYVQYRGEDSVRPGVSLDGRIYDLGEISSRMGRPWSFPSLRHFIEAGEEVWGEVARWKGDVEKTGLVALKAIGEQDEVSLEAPLREAKKFILLAGNYREHIREVGYQVPERAESITPQFFMKPPSTTLIGHRQPIILPRTQNCSRPWAQ